MIKDDFIHAQIWQIAQNKILPLRLKTLVQLCQNCVDS